MDRHDLPGATPEDLAAAHIQDVEIQEQYGVRYLTYWFDQESGTAFCLADGPDQDAVNAVHQHSHGLMANRIVEVDAALLGSILGRISEHRPGEAYVETAVRTIMFTDIAGSTELTRALGDAAAMKMLRTHDTVVRRALALHQGNEVKHTGDGIMASFASVTGAVGCAIKIQRDLAGHNQNSEVPVRVRVGLNAGEPVTERGDLFGVAVQMASRLCAQAEPEEVLVSSVVRELAGGKGYEFRERGHAHLKGFEAPVPLFAVDWR